jgi:hypothetical protein
MVTTFHAESATEEIRYAPNVTVAALIIYQTSHAESVKEVDGAVGTDAVVRAAVLRDHLLQPQSYSYLLNQE